MNEVPGWSTFVRIRANWALAWIGQLARYADSGPESLEQRLADQARNLREEARFSSTRRTPGTTIAACPAMRDRNPNERVTAVSGPATSQVAISEAVEVGDVKSVSSRRRMSLTRLKTRPIALRGERSIASLSDGRSTRRAGKVRSSPAVFSLGFYCAWVPCQL